MKSFLLKILALVILYGLCMLLWNIEQALGIGRQFVYAVF